MSVRCFVGIPLPENYQMGLGDIRQEWDNKLDSRIAWTKQGNWHLTLYFLGEISEGSLEDVQAQLAQVTMDKFSLQAKGGGFFPPNREPRVIWLGVQKGGQECVELASKVENALLPLGFEKSKKEFKPHLTLGRVKKNKKDNWRDLQKYLNQIYWSEIRIDSFILWQSELTPQGPVYKRIREFALN